MDEDRQLRAEKRHFEKPGPRKPMPSWALGLVLSLVVVAMWALFLQVAPSPTDGLPPAPAVTEAAPPPAQATPAAEEVRLLLWRNVLPPEVLAGFEAESGLKVVVQNYDTAEQLDALIAGNAVAADLAVMSGVGVRRFVAGDLLAPLPPLAGAPALDPALTARAGVYDPGNGHSAVVQWGTLGIAYDAAKIAERIGVGAVDSWDLLFNPEAMAKLADCGVQVVDSPAGVFPIALIHLGRPVDSAGAEDTEAAARAWEAVRPSIAAFANAGVVDGLAEGRVCLALTTSGDAFQARRKALAQAGGKIDIRYAVPKEGTIVWYALLAMPKAAVNTAGAAKLADYLLRPDVAAKLSNTQGLGNAVPASASAVAPELKNDPGFMPPGAAFAGFTPEVEPSEAAAALRNRFWQLINTAPAAPKTP